MTTVYRRDIDGLRALAVLAVVAFHAFPNTVRGGFVGVDVFFVISGFLITGIICKGLTEKRFSLVGFYARRARRIFPALAIVLAACAIAGWFVLFPDDYHSLARNIAAGAGFVANFALLQEAGYFDQAAELKPLLHLWSLGVEEQFYLVWPLLLVATWRWRRGPLVVAGALFALSFLSNVLLSDTYPEAAFFLPVTRFWELMLGCLIALSQSGRDSNPLPAGARASEALAWAGLALILGAVGLIDRDSVFPGWWALMPAFGAALIIIAGPAASLNRWLLGHRALVYVGLISYPLYLWHWPILSFARTLGFKEPTDLKKLALIGVAFVLADLTYRLIEKPIRFGRPLAWKPLGATLALALAGCLGLWIAVRDGFPGRFPPDLQRVLADSKTAALEAYRQGTCFLKPDGGVPTFSDICDGGEGGGRRLMLWGDSHAAHIYPGLKTLAAGAPDLRLAEFTAAGCPPLFHFANRQNRNCRAINAFVAGKIERLKPDTVILAGRWELYDGMGGWGRLESDHIAQTLARLQSLGVRRVVAVGQFPVWVSPLPKIRAQLYRQRAAGLMLAGDHKVSKRNRRYLKRSGIRIDATLGPVFSSAGAVFVSPSALFCNADGCLLAVPDTSESLAWDDSHLTIAGSDYFARAFAKTLIGR